MDVFGRADASGQLITRRMVAERWDELAAHATTCRCDLCTLLPLATPTKVWRLAARWQTDVNKTRILARR